MPCLSTMACRFLALALSFSYVRSATKECPLSEMTPQTFTVQRKIPAVENRMEVEDDDYNPYMISHLFKSIWIWTLNTDLYASDDKLWASLESVPGSQNSEIQISDCNGKVIAKFIDGTVYDSDMKKVAVYEKIESTKEAILLFDSLDSPPQPIARITMPQLVPVPFIKNLPGMGGLVWTTDIEITNYKSLEKAQENEKVVDSETESVENELSSAANIVTDPRVILLAGAWAFGQWKLSPLCTWIITGLFVLCCCCCCCVGCCAGGDEDEKKGKKVAASHGNSEHEALIEDPHKTKHVSEAHEPPPAATSSSLFSCCSRRQVIRRETPAPAPAPAHGHGGQRQMVIVRANEMRKEGVSLIGTDGRTAHRIIEGEFGPFRGHRVRY